MENNNHQSVNPTLLVLAIIVVVISTTTISILFTQKEQDSPKLIPEDVSQTELAPPPIDKTPIIFSSSEAPDVKSANLAWFTSLPKKDTDILMVAKWFDLFILIQGDEENRDFIRYFGVKGPILQYIDFMSIQDPGSCDTEPKLNQVTYLPGDFCTISTIHSDWFLLNQDGERIKELDNDNTWYLMDPGNEGWRNFFLERIETLQSDPNWDGVFLDNFPLSLAFQESNNNIPAKYPDDQSFQSITQSFLKFLKTNYFQPNGKLIFANMVSRRNDVDWGSQINFIDGAMIEGWAIDWPDGYRPSDIWEKHMEYAEITQREGKYIVLVSLGNRQNNKLQNFSYASFLLINEGNASFRYANSDEYNEIWIYDNYSLNLGSPMNSRYKTEQGWMRDFTNGFVIVNPETHFSQIILR